MQANQEVRKTDAHQLSKKKKQNKPKKVPSSEHMSSNTTDSTNGQPSLYKPKNERNQQSGGWSKLKSELSQEFFNHNSPPQSPFQQNNFTENEFYKQKNHQAYSSLKQSYYGENVYGGKVSEAVQQKDTMHNPPRFNESNHSQVGYRNCQHVTQHQNKLSNTPFYHNQSQPHSARKQQASNVHDYGQPASKPGQVALTLGKAKISVDCYSYSYYIDYLPTMGVKNEGSNKIQPDILYTQKKDGEILIEWNATTKELSMLTFVDLQEVYPEKQNVAIELALSMQKLYHPNLLNLTAPVMILDHVQTLVFRSESPDHISSWKQFCKTTFSLEEKLSIFRQLTSALTYLHEQGIVHRDMHPTRIHLHNGVVKFNTVGLPYNFKKLLRSECFTGHVNFSAPEIIKDSSNFSSKIDVWSLGCCLFYLETKLDPFEGKNIGETKRKIANLQLFKNDKSGSFTEHSNQNYGWHPIIHKLIFRCLQLDQNQRPTAAELIQFQDLLEIQTFGEPISKNSFIKHWETLKANTNPDCLKARVNFDRESVDYRGMNLNNRNCPWFFSKSYGHLQPANNNKEGEDEEAISIFKDNSGIPSDISDDVKPQSAYIVPKVTTMSARAGLDEPEDETAFLMSGGLSLGDETKTEKASGLFGTGWSDFFESQKVESSFNFETPQQLEQPSRSFQPDSGLVQQQFTWNNSESTVDTQNKEVISGQGTDCKGNSYVGSFVRQGHGQLTTSCYIESNLSSSDKESSPQLLAQTEPTVLKTVYEGNWQGDMRHGSGKQSFFSAPISKQQQIQSGNSMAKAEYQGDWQTDQFHGFGKLRSFFPSSQYGGGNNKNSVGGGQNKVNASRYEGSFKEGCRHGQGTLNFACGSIYEGEFSDNHINGIGHFSFANALAQYQGVFEKGKFNGLGLLNFARGNIMYHGEFVKGFFSGRGKLVNLIHNFFYEGLWFKGKMHGDGVLFHYDVIPPPQQPFASQQESEKIRRDLIFHYFQIPGVLTATADEGESKPIQPHPSYQFRLLSRFQGQWKHGQRCGYGKLTTFTYSSLFPDAVLTHVSVSGFWQGDTLTHMHSFDESDVQF